MRRFSARTRAGPGAGVRSLGIATIVTGAFFVSPTAVVAAASTRTPAMPLAAVKIVSSRATIARLGPSGGLVEVKGTVKNAQECQLSLLWKPAVDVVYSHSPTTGCKEGSYSAKVVIGPNNSSVLRTVALHLVARNPSSSAAATLYVTVAAKALPVTTTTTTTVPTPTLSPVPLSVPTVSTPNGNWAGYVVHGGPFTGVGGTFTVPETITGNINDAVSQWVGIDGIGSQALIQAGVVEQYYNTGQIAVTPWWEILPANATNITTMTVSAGDSVTVDIFQVTGTTWQISIVDNTNPGQSFSTTQTYSGPGASAEWILEAPSSTDNQVLSLPSFSPAVAFSGLGQVGFVTTLDERVMQQDSTTVATPSAITSSGFSVSYSGPSQSGP